MQATAEGRTSGRHGPGAKAGIRAVENGSTNGTGRVPPHNPAVERSLLGAMLTSTSAVEVAMSALAPDDFYDHKHRSVAAAIFALAIGGGKVDPVLVANQLRRDGQWVDEMGADFISWMSEVPALGNAGEYATIVRGCARQRQMRSVAAALDDAAQDGDDGAIARALETAHDVVAGGRPELVFEDLGAVLRGEVPELLPTMLYRSDGQALVYPGLLHWIMGEPGCGKTWMALIAALAVVQARSSAMYLDYEGSRRIVGHRLSRLGATEVDVEGIDYTRPFGPSATTGPAAARQVREHGHELVIVDGAAKAMAADGLDEDRASDVLGWLQRLVWPMCAAGAAVIVLDHVPKDKDGRGRWARGSGAKLGEVDGAAYNVRVGKAWSRTQAGYAAVDVAKDREGVVGAVGDTVALLKFAPGQEVLATVDAPDGTDEAAVDTIHAAVLRALRTLEKGGEMSQIRLENEVRQFGKWSHFIIRNAAETLAESGRISVRIGPRNARLYSVIDAPRSDVQLHIVDPPQEDF